jgi:uncharacterized protein (DUF488 family)
VRILVEQRDLVIYTVGYSTRSIDEFIELLKIHNITLLVDIRAVPRSRHNPQFNKETLPNTLKTCGVKYLSFPDIGVLQHPKKNSINPALKTSSFRGYADFMQTKEFLKSLLKLIVLAKENCIALMCSEALPWSCHRSLLSDVLLVRRVKVLHIINKDSVLTHQLNELAYVTGTKVSYPLFNHEETPQRTLDDFGTV